MHADDNTRQIAIENPLSWLYGRWGSCDAPNNSSAGLHYDNRGAVTVPRWTSTVDDGNASDASVDHRQTD